MSHAKSSCLIFKLLPDPNTLLQMLFSCRYLSTLGIDELSLDIIISLENLIISIKSYPVYRIKNVTPSNRSHCYLVPNTYQHQYNTASCAHLLSEQSNSLYTVSRTLLSSYMLCAVLNIRIRWRNIGIPFRHRPQCRPILILYFDVPLM